MAERIIAFCRHNNIVVRWISCRRQIKFTKFGLEDVTGSFGNLNLLHLRLRPERYRKLRPYGTWRLITKNVYHRINIIWHSSKLLLMRIGSLSEQWVVPHLWYIVALPRSLISENNRRQKSRQKLHLMNECPLIIQNAKMCIFIFNLWGRTISLKKWFFKSNLRILPNILKSIRTFEKEIDKFFSIYFIFLSIATFWACISTETLKLLRFTGQTALLRFQSHGNICWKPHNRRFLKKIHDFFFYEICYNSQRSKLVNGSRKSRW